MSQHPTAIGKHPVKMVFSANLWSHLNARYIRLHHGEIFEELIYDIAGRKAFLREIDGWTNWIYRPHWRFLTPLEQLAWEA